ncbi:MAG: hypothetical protein ABIA76_03155 [Candidatus Diapherotrites archaeon]
MATKQINLKMPSNLYSNAESFAETYGYRNVQDLTLDSLREKIFEKGEYDESFTEKEIELIDALIEKTIKKKDFAKKEDVMKALE